MLLEQVPKKRDKTLPSPGRRVVEKVREMYEQVGLPRHPGKAVEQAEVAEFWGAEVNGVEGRVRPNLKRTVSFSPRVVPHGAGWSEHCFIAGSDERSSGVLLSISAALHVDAPRDLLCTEREAER